MPKNGGLTQADVEIIIRQEMDKLQSHFKSLGCGSEVGCPMGKRHFQEHADKWSSDINDSKEYMKTNDEANRVTAGKLEIASSLLHEACADIKNMLQTFSLIKGDHEKRMDRLDSKLFSLDLKFWGVMVLLVSLAITAFWKGSEFTSSLSSSVKTINSVDRANQMRTENLMKEIIIYLKK